MSPTISVVMAAYKEPEFVIRESLDSLLIQDYTDFEIVIILDAPSNEKLWKILQDYQSANKKKITVVRNPANLGLALSLNKAIKYSSGEFIARMDSDDICLPNRLSDQLEYLMEHTRTSLIGSAVYLIDEKGKRVGEAGVPLLHEDVSKVIEKRMPMFHSTWMGRREVFENIRYRQFPAAQDYDFLLRLVDEGYRLSNIDKPLLIYRIRKSGVSRRKLAIQNRCASLALKLHKEREKYGYELTRIERKSFRPSRFDVLVTSCWLAIINKKETSRSKCVRKACKMLHYVVNFFMPLTRRSIKHRIINKFRRRSKAA